MTVPHTTVLVAGGGPAGSLAAAILAREGVDVTLVEKARHPRYHIGESLLTSVMPILEFVGVKERIELHGFVKKYGGFFRVKQGERAGHVDFTKLSRYKHSYQVLRSEFDELLFDHARQSGAKVQQDTAVGDIEFLARRPVTARLTSADGSVQPIAFDYMVDATGQTGLLSAHYFQNRKPEEAFANVAVGGYFRGAHPYRDHDGVEQPGAFSMEALTDGSGWTWAIPLHDGTLSVGVVLHRDIYRERHKRLGSNELVFERTLETSPDVTALIQDATREGESRVWRDYSYFAEHYAGPGYRLAGDAAGFIDPLFSTGVHMACLGALSSAATICSEIRGELDSEELETFHHRYLSLAYTRLVVTVAGFYQQLHDQDRIVLPGVTSDNFQRAFDLIQPVVSGNLDLNADEVTEDALRRAMHYTKDMMLELHDLETNNKIAKLLVLDALDSESGQASSDPIDDLYVRMRRGDLGLSRISEEESSEVAARRRSIRDMVARSTAPSRRSEASAR